MTFPMDPQYHQDPMAHQTDEAMGDAPDNIATTPTHYQNGRRQSQSTDYGNPLSPSQEDPNQNRYPSNPSSYQQQPQPYSRPSSGLSGQTYQDQRHSGQKEQSSVVIKVGMVGDAQIGKTSLMVKYVEGSWDEDYIQTLGTFPSLLSLAFVCVHAAHITLSQASTSWKRQFPSATPKSHSPSGISAANANS